MYTATTDFCFFFEFAASELWWIVSKPSDWENRSGILLEAWGGGVVGRGEGGEAVHSFPESLGDDTKNLSELRPVYTYILYVKL